MCPQHSRESNAEHIIALNAKIVYNYGVCRYVYIYNEIEFSINFP